MKVETIAGMPVRLEVTPFHAQIIRTNVEALARLVPLQRVEVESSSYGGPRLGYHVSNPRVRVYCPADTAPERIAAAIARETKRILRHEDRSDASRRIDAADAHLATRLPSARAALDRLARTALDAPSMHLWAGNNHSFCDSTASVKIDDGLAFHLAGNRVWIARYTHMETWSQGNLVTGRKLQIPDTVMATLKGRSLDRVVEGTMLAGADLVIRNAWMNGGRLGLTFEKNEVALDDVRRDLHGMRLAA